ncbi:hypothetical protein KC19_11G064100 [Ceratodon purpureus]|uniref:Uncharacterized protein n=1 Tax=Ceratodon purpureus TaxID=3225 RepID=A0A8T0GB33_CERPU|nr:hypothetical protein KC19_11G064100 [Ceratodon purpureus]
MRAVKSIERLIRELQLSPEGGQPPEDDDGQQLQLWSPRTRSTDSLEDSPRRSRILALPSTRRDSPKLSGNQTGSRLLREELEKVSKQLAEQRALVATLEVEITTVLQEKKIQELDYKSHVQQLEDKVARLKQRLRGYTGEEAGATVCEDLLRLLQELFSHDITVGQPLYGELLTIPPERRKARDHILMLIYEKMHKSHENYERCWNDRESLRCTLAQANQQIQRLDTDLKQACKIAASEKQEMLQEVERLTSQWRDLSVAAAGEKQELVKEVQKLNDELSEVTETAALEKQEIRDEVEQLTLKLRNSQDIAHKDRKSMRIEIQRLANEIQQGLTTAASEKQLLNEEVQLLNNKLRVTVETAANDKIKLNTEIARLLGELQQQSTTTTTEKRTLSAEVTKLKDELRELTTTSAAEKQEMTKEIQKLTNKVKQLLTTSTAEKQAMQLKLDVANTRNDRLAKEYQHALVQLESLTDECNTTDIQLKDKQNGVTEKKLFSRGHETELTDANIHELMDETRQLLERIEFKDHSMTFLNKVTLPEFEQNQSHETQQTVLQVAQEKNSIQDPIEAHIVEISSQEQLEVKY